MKSKILKTGAVAALALAAPTVATLALLSLAGLLRAAN